MLPGIELPIEGSSPFLLVHCGMDDEEESLELKWEQMREGRNGDHHGSQGSWDAIFGGEVQVSFSTKMTRWAITE